MGNLRQCRYECKLVTSILENTLYILKNMKSSNVWWLPCICSREMEFRWWHLQSFGIIFHKHQYIEWHELSSMMYGWRSVKHINNEGERNPCVYIVDKPWRHYVKQEDTRNRRSSTVQFHWYTESDFFFQPVEFCKQHEDDQGLESCRSE